jgi:hypothetical protein
VSSNNGSHHRRHSADRLVRAFPGSITHPITADAHTQGNWRKSRGRSAPVVLAVVVTLTLESVAVVALTASVAGTTQVAPVGAPVQLSEAIPLIPAPPMESEYVAVAPPQPSPNWNRPGAIPRANELAPVPVSEIVCGLLGTLSVMVRVQLCGPVLVGVKLTRTWHVSCVKNRRSCVIQFNNTPKQIHSITTKPLGFALHIG